MYIIIYLLEVNNHIGILWCRQGTSTGDYGLTQVTYPITFKNTYSVQLTCSLTAEGFTSTSTATTRIVSLGHFNEYSTNFVKVQKLGIKFIFAVGKI